MMKKYKIFYKKELIDTVPADSPEQAIMVIENMLQISIKGAQTYFHVEEIKENWMKRVSNEVKFIRSMKKVFIEKKRDEKMASLVRNRNLSDKYREMLAYAVKDKSLSREAAEEIIKGGLKAMKKWSESHQF